jgi:hypothetical protein
LHEGFGVEASGWKGERRTAMGSRPDTRGFYTAVARWAVAQGWLRLAFLRVGGKAVAFDFSLDQSPRHYLVKTGFDPRFARFAPGILLRHAMLRRAFELGFATYEFLGDDEPWKLRWASQRRDRLLVQAFRHTPGATAERWAFEFGRPAALRARKIVRSLARR